MFRLVLRGFWVLEGTFDFGSKNICRVDYGLK